jgi:enamine deaminase RidA (YjgF/YER057c/UK114 family)
MKDIIKYSSGTKWEEFVGYSRAIRIGNEIITSGTTATDPNGNIIGPGDPYIQTKTIIEKTEQVLEALGAKLENVVKTVIYTTDISKWEEIGKAHGEYFKTIKPVTSLVEISGLVVPEMMVEIEFRALL